MSIYIFEAEKVGKRLDNNLKKQAVSGVKWTSFLSLTNAILGIVYRLILVALLLPGEYAYIAVLAFFIGLSELANNLGVGEAILQKDEEIEYKILSSLFFFNLLISTILAVVLLLLAPEIEQYYGSGYGNLTLLLRITSITVILNGTSSLFRVYLQKNFLFKWVVVSMLTKLIIDIIVTVTLILLGFGIIGYVIGTVTATAAFASMITFFCIKNTDIRIVLHFRPKDVTPFLKFGIFISLKQIFTFVAQRVDELIIGGLLSADVLGVYFFAKDFIRKPQNLITQSFSQVMFPLFSKVKNNKNSLVSMYNNSSKYIALVAFPVFIGIAVTAELFVPLLFGEEWMASIIPIRVFSITGILLVLTANFSTSILYALNKPNEVLYVEVLSNLFYFTLLAFVSNYGIYAILIVNVIYTIVKTFSLQFLVSKVLDFSVFKYLLSLRKVAILSLIMGLAVYLTMSLVSINIWIQFILSVLVGTLLYVVLVIIFDKILLKKAVMLFK